MKKVFVLNDAMNIDGASYIIRENVANELSKDSSVIMISPSEKIRLNLFTNKISNTFQLFYSPAILPVSLRRGGFDIIDLLFKSLMVLFYKPDMIYVIAGHRPSQLIPSLIGKLLYKSIIVDERWEFFGKGGRADEKKSILGRFIAQYDYYFEKKFLSSFDHVIAISSKLKRKLNNENVDFFPGVIDYKNFNYYTIDTARKKLFIEDNCEIISLIALGKLDHNDYKILYSAIDKLLIMRPNLKLFCTGEKKYISENILPRFKDRVIYNGWVSKEKLDLYLSASNIFILPLNKNLRNLCRWPIKYNDFVFFNRFLLINEGHDVSDFVKSNKIIKCSNNVNSYIKKTNYILDYKIDNCNSSSENFIEDLSILSRASLIKKMLCER